MPDFGELLNKAKKMASEHPDQVAKGVEKLEELVDKQTGGEHSSQIESAGHAVENYLGAHESGQQGQAGQQRQPGQQRHPGQQGQSAQQDQGGQQGGQTQ